MVQFFDPYEEPPVDKNKFIKKEKGGYWLLPGHPEYDDSDDANYYDTNWRDTFTLRERLAMLPKRLREYFRGPTGYPGPMGAIGDRGFPGDVKFLTAKDAQELMLSDAGREGLKAALRELIKEDPSLIGQLK